MAESTRGREGRQVDGLRGSGAARGDFAGREVRRLSLRPRRLLGRLGQPGWNRQGLQPHQGQRGRAPEPRDANGRFLARRRARHSLDPRIEQRFSGCRLGGADDGRPASAVPERRLRARLVARRNTHRLSPAGGGRSLFVTPANEKVGRQIYVAGLAFITIFPSGRSTARSSTSSTACRSMKATSGAFARTAGNPSG